LKLAASALKEVLDVDHHAVRAELPQIREYLERFDERLPHEFQRQLTRLEGELSGE
jgi:GTP-dependent phosphoenolpyruvate carboxykinase